MPCYAKIAVHVPGVQDLFDYSIPQEFEHTLATGWLVEVPFGKQAVQGIILAIKQHSDVPNPRPIATILEEAPVLTIAQIKLAQWLSETYLSPISTFLFAMLPPGLGQRADTLYKLNPSTPGDSEALSGLQKRLLGLLKEKGKLRGRQVGRRRLPACGLARFRTRPCSAAGYLITEPVLPKPAVKKKQIRSVMIADPQIDLDAIQDQLGKTRL